MWWRREGTCQLPCPLTYPNPYSPVIPLPGGKEVLEGTVAAVVCVVWLVSVPSLLC